MYISNLTKYLHSPPGWLPQFILPICPIPANIWHFPASNSGESNWYKCIIHCLFICVSLIKINLSNYYAHNNFGGDFIVYKFFGSYPLSTVTQLCFSC